MDEVLGFQLADESDLIFQLTANVKRKVRELLVLAYLHARNSGSKKITKDYLLAAYKSERYKAMREDVAAIFTQSITGKPVPKYAPLWCPVDPKFNILPASASGAGAAVTSYRTRQHGSIIRQPQGCEHPPRKHARQSVSAFQHP
jgi:hypothetical protein